MYKYKLTVNKDRETTSYLIESDLQFAEFARSFQSTKTYVLFKTIKSQENKEAYLLNVANTLIHITKMSHFAHDATTYTIEF